MESYQYSADTLQAFAFWELVYIAQRFEGRRKIIFEDIDRAGGSTWSQILSACLEQINGVTSRINEFQNPKPKGAAASTITQDAGPELPKLVQPLKDGLQKPGDLFTASPPPATRAASMAQSLETYAKSHSVSTNEGGLLRATAKQASEKMLTPQQQAVVSPEGLKGLFMEHASSFLRTPLGVPFRNTYRRRLTTVVLGSPYGDVGIIVDAVDSLTRLAVCSLKEDKYGNVQRDIKQIIQVLTSMVLALEKFKETIGFHWTDIERKKECPEVDTLLAAAKGGLHDLVVTFGDFSRDLKLSAAEMRMAREAAAAHPSQEMQETREGATTSGGK